MLRLILQPRLVCVLVGVLSSLSLAGCQRPVGSISGKVTYNGKALKGGSVSFVSTEGRQSFASGISQDGTYNIPDIAGGSYKICVDTSSLQVKGAAPTPPKQATIPKEKGLPPDVHVPEGYTPSSPAAAAAAAAQKRYIAIPDKYREPDTTDLTYTFKGGSETHDIELK